MLVTTSPSKPTSAIPFQKFSVSSVDGQTDSTDKSQSLLCSVCMISNKNHHYCESNDLCWDVRSLWPEISLDSFLSADSSEIELQSAFPLRISARSSPTTPPLPRTTWAAINRGGKKSMLVTWEFQRLGFGGQQPNALHWLPGPCEFDSKLLAVDPLTVESQSVFLIQSFDNSDYNLKSMRVSVWFISLISCLWKWLELLCDQLNTINSRRWEMWIISSLTTTFDQGKYSFLFFAWIFELVQC